MANSRLRIKFQEITYDDVLSWTMLLFAFAFGVLTTVFVAYAITFAGKNSSLSHDPAVWGQFGDFVGGTANPILGFLTLIGLLLTLLLQGKQLENSKRELEQSSAELILTRKELARSAQAQEHAQKALSDQASAMERSTSLSSLNVLLEVYRREIATYNSQVLAASDPRLGRLRLLKEREQLLVAKLDLMFLNTSNRES